MLARGVGSLAFEKRLTVPYFKYKDYERKIAPIKPRTPAEIMHSAWEDVGSRMWEAIREVEKEHGQQIAK